MTTNDAVHVRASELAAALAVDIQKVVDGYQPGRPLFEVSAWNARTDIYPISQKVLVTETSWTAGQVPTVVIKLANGQEFELEVRPSSEELRQAARDLEYARRRAERAQDKANNRQEV